MTSKGNQHLFRLVREGAIENLNLFLGDTYQDDSWKKELQEKSGDSILHIATRFGHLRLVKWLVEEKGMNPFLANHDGKTVLHEAAHFGQLSCLEFLLDQGLSVNSLKRADWTPLMLACTKTNLDVVRCLVQAGANPRLRNKDGWNSFHIACREGDVDIIVYLLESDNSLWNVVSKNKRSPLHTSALHGHLEGTGVLLERGQYESDPTDSCGSTPLMDALRGGHTQVAQLLISHNKADIHKEDAMGRSCLHLSAQVGSEKSVKYLVHDLGIDVNISSSVSGITPLHLAAKEGQLHMITVLCSLGADIHSQDTKGRTALHQACGGHFTECVQALVSAGAIDSPDNNGIAARDMTRKQQILDILQNKTTS